jgi:protein TonB
MKSTAQFLMALALFPVVGQNSSQPPSGASTQDCDHVTSSGDCIVAPHAIFSPDPEWPAKERSRGHGGIVVLRFVVDIEGVPNDITVSQSLSPAFDASAVECMKKWRFSPSTKNGKPIKANAEMQITFHPTSR